MTAGFKFLPKKRGFCIYGTLHDGTVRTGRHWRVKLTIQAMRKSPKPSKTSFPPSTFEQDKTRIHHLNVRSWCVKQMGFLNPYINCRGHLTSNDIIMNYHTGTHENPQNVWEKQTSRPVMDPRWTYTEQCNDTGNSAFWRSRGRASW